MPAARLPPFVVSCLLLASACSGAHEPVQTTTVAPRAGIAPTANVPSLVGLSIDGLASRQPLPARFAKAVAVISAESELARQDSLASFNAGGLTLIACYSARSRQVHSLLLPGHHEDSLMARASLHTNASQYLVLPVFGAKGPSYLLGLRIVAIN